MEAQLPKWTAVLAVHGFREWRSMDASMADRQEQLTMSITVPLAAVDTINDSKQGVSQPTPPHPLPHPSAVL
ncbi:hypothetical protein WJX82_001178 [Trebouxia sp. C0006]